MTINEYASQWWGLQGILVIRCTLHKDMFLNCFSIILFDSGVKLCFFTILSMYIFSVYNAIPCQ